METKVMLTIVFAVAARAVPGFALPVPIPASQGCYMHAVVEEVEGSDAYATGTVNCLMNSASTTSEQPAKLAIHASNPASAQALLHQNIFVSRKDLKDSDAMIGEYNLTPSQLGMVGVQEKSGAQSEVTFDHAALLSLAAMTVTLGDSASSLVQKVRRGGGGFRGGGGRAFRGGGARWHRGGARWHGGGRGYAYRGGRRGYWRGGVWVPLVGYGYSGCDPDYEYCGGGGYYSNGVWIGGGRGGYAHRGGGARWHGGRGHVSHHRGGGVRGGRGGGGRRR